ncbi:PHD finger protein 3-like isoform X1 [Myxocyprinus asiaticus]|uniref:PHD finger protein 3-like isoform X1 n=1 Tax=Myxocyprinus asiaticus TaxID=70543 RepID=UPI0022219651|nr:PHD finger protein 3-like isoform X1 [Myxocyprinus asiaticus]
MDIVGGPFNHLVPSDQLDDSLLLGQNLECEASDEFDPGRNQPEDSLKNMLSDKDPMFGSASDQFHLLENEDVNFKLGDSADADHDITTGVSQSPSDEENGQPSFSQGRRHASHPQRRQTASRGRVKGAPGRRPGSARRTAGRNDQEATSSGNSYEETSFKKREALLSRRFGIHEVDSSMNPVVVLRRLTVTVGGYKIELLPGPSHSFGSFSTSALQSLGFQDNSMTADGIGLDLGQNQDSNTQEIDNSTQEVVEEVIVGQPGSDDMPIDFGPYVNPNDVQDAKSTMAFKPSMENAAPADTKSNDQIKTRKPSMHKSQNKNGTAVEPVVKKLLKHKQTLSAVKNKHSQLGRPGLLQKVSKHNRDKKIHVNRPEKFQSHKGKPANVSLKRPGGPLSPESPSKIQKSQDGHLVHQNVSSSVPASANVGRKPSSDSGPGVKSVLNKSPHHSKKPQNPPTPVNKTNPPVTNSQGDEEQEKMKIKKPEKIQLRHKSRNSRSISIEEPQLFIPDNAPVVKKEAEGDPPPPESETMWDPNKHCGLCKKPHNNRFMVGCGHCDDWFHGDCVGLDLAKVQQMEKEDQEYVCLKCCAEEDGKPGGQATEQSDDKLSCKQKQRSQQSLTAGGIRPFRKDIGERRPSEDSAPRSGPNVKHETKKLKVFHVSSKKPSTGQIRRNVRDSLEDILLKRLKESDLKISLDKPAELARKMEKELFALFQGVDSKYKNKYRSLTFNLRDAKNNVLYKRVLKGEVSPADLVRMTAEELASKELAAWRQRENRHTIEMIEKGEREAERRPITKITHKGEIEIENQEPTKAPEAIEVEPEPVPKAVIVPEEKLPETKADSPKKSVDTTSLHKSHLFDLNCKICTGRMAPPSEEASTKVMKVATTVVRRQSSAAEEHPSSTTTPALMDDLSLRAMEEGLLNFLPESRSDSLSSKEDTATFLSNLEKLWGGFVDMLAVARFLTKAYPVSGILDHLTQDLPDNIQVGGRISPQIVWDYVEKIRASGTKEICIIRFTPDTEEDEISYTLLYAYFSSRRRYGVVANNRKQVKDMYLIPLGSTEKIPHQIVPFDGPGLETNRPNLLLGLVIRQRPKRDFGVILPSEVSEAPSFLVESKPQVNYKQKASMAQDVDRSFISVLGTTHKEDTEDLIKTVVDEPMLDTETNENVSLRFLPGVLKLPGNTTSTSSDNAESVSTTPVPKTSTVDGGSQAGIHPKNTSSASRLDRFIIKKKDHKTIKTEDTPSNSSLEKSSEVNEKESNPQTGIVLSLSDKPPDVSTESFLSSLTTAKPKEESSNTDAKSSSAAPSSQETNETTLSNASKYSVNDSSNSVPKNEIVLSPTKTIKTPPPGILKKGSLSSDPTDLKPPVSNSETSQQKVNLQPPSQLSQECKAIEDIQPITTISSTGKNEGLKQSRSSSFNPNVYSPPSQGPPPPVFPSYLTGAPEHQYHPVPVHHYPPPANPAPFIPLLSPPPFPFPPGPPPQVFSQTDPQSHMLAPPWPQTLPPPMLPGPPMMYENQRVPEPSLPTPSPSSKDEKGSDKSSRRSEDTYKKDDRDHYDRHHHKSKHYDRDREKHRDRSHSHKDRHSKDDRHERPRERHHSSSSSSSHHRDRDKYRRDSDYEKHRRDSRDRRS